MAATASQAQPVSIAATPGDEAAMDVHCYSALALEGAAIDNKKAKASRDDRDRAFHYLSAIQFFGGRLTARYPMTDLVSVLRSTPPMAAGRKRQDAAFACVQLFQITMLSIGSSLRDSLNVAPAPAR